MVHAPVSALRKPLVTFGDVSFVAFSFLSRYTQRCGALEDGYEAKCCLWKPTLEERIVAKVHELYQQIGTVATK